MIRPGPLVLAAAAIVAAYPVACAAGDGKECVRFTSQEPTLHVSLARETAISGRPPATFCGIEPGARYRMTVGGPGFERRSGFFLLENGRIKAGGRRLVLTARNAVVPGWGTAVAGRGTIAIADFLSIAAVGYAALDGHRDLRHLENRLDVVEREIAASPGRADELAGARSIAAADVETKRTRRDRLAGLAGVLYLRQMIDPFLLSPPPGVHGVDGDGVATARVETGRLRRSKAFLFSLLGPGRGQSYQGKRTRGFLFETGAVAAAILAIEYDARLELENHRLEEATGRIDTGMDEETRRRVEAEAAGYRDDADEAGRRRNLAVGAFAGLWGLSLLDTFIPGGGGDVPRWSLRPHGRGVALCMRF